MEDIQNQIDDINLQIVITKQDKNSDAYLSNNSEIQLVHSKLPRANSVNRAYFYWNHVRIFISSVALFVIGCVTIGGVFMTAKIIGAIVTGLGYIIETAVPHRIWFNYHDAVGVLRDNYGWQK